VSAWIFCSGKLQTEESISQHTVALSPKNAKKVSYKLLEENAKIFVTVLIADSEHSQVYITSGWSVYQTIKSAIS